MIWFSFIESKDLEATCLAKVFSPCFLVIFLHNHNTSVWCLPRIFTLQGSGPLRYSGGGKGLYFLCEVVEGATGKEEQCDPHSWSFREN